MAYQCLQFGSGSDISVVDDSVEGILRSSGLLNYHTANGVA